MDKMDNARERTFTEEDPFLRLPAELLLSTIFSRLADLKSLFRCSLVSKHLASVISHVRTVSITVSGSETYCYYYSRIMAKLVTDLHTSTVDQIPALLDSPSLQHMKLPKFLEKLTELEQIHLEYEDTGNGVQPLNPTWEVKFAGNSAKIESFVALVFAGSVHIGDSEDESDSDQEEEDSDQEEEGNGQEQEVDGVDIITEIRKCSYLFHGRYMEWMCVIGMLLKYHSSLQRVTITDSRKQGTLVIGHEQLVNIGNEVFDEVLKELSQKIIRTVRLPVLSLPLSGYFMRRVTVLILHAPGDDPHASDDASTVIKELVQLILKNHRDRIRYYGPLCLP